MTEIIAHRGSSFEAPENTLSAVRLAWEQDADAVEVDVRLTADGKIVVLHDANLRRTAGIDARIDSLRLVELKTIDVGRWKSEQFAGERLPTLEALLTTTPRGKRFFVEIKCGVEIVEELSRVVKTSPTPFSVVPIGFSLPLLQAVKQSLPECKVYGVFKFEPADVPGTVPVNLSKTGQPSAEKEEEGKPLPRDAALAVKELIARAGDHHLDGVDLEGAGPIPEAMVASLKNAGLDVCVWTVDSPQRAARIDCRRCGRHHHQSARMAAR